MREHPLVSILVPSFNHARFIRRTLKSILAERSLPIEVVVSDDGSTDGSQEAIRSVRDSRIVLINGPRQGIAANFNAAFRHSKGDIIMRCDSDDLYAKGRIERQVRWLAEHPKHGAVCGSFAAMRGWLSAPLACAGDESRDITEDLNAGQVDTHFNTYAIRRDVLESVGGANTEFRTCDDVDLQLRLSEVSRIAYEPEIAYYWRLVDSSVTHTTSAEIKSAGEQKARDDQARRFGRTSAAQVADQPTIPSSEHLQNLLIGCAWASPRRTDRIAKSILAIFAKPSSGWKNLAAAIVRS